MNSSRYLGLGGRDSRNTAQKIIDYLRERPGFTSTRYLRLSLHRPIDFDASYEALKADGTIVEVGTGRTSDPRMCGLARNIPPEEMPRDPLPPFVTDVAPEVWERFSIAIAWNYPGIPVVDVLTETLNNRAMEEEEKRKAKLEARPLNPVACPKCGAKPPEDRPPAERWKWLADHIDDCNPGGKELVARGGTASDPNEG